MPTLSLLQRFRAPSADQLAQARTFRAQLEQPCQQVLETGDAWLEQPGYEQEHERLANLAAIHRWEMVRLSEQVRALQPPELLMPAHRELGPLLADAARAFQLLATGHRYHKTDAVCDGQSLLLATVADVRRVLRGLDQRLAERP